MQAAFVGAESVQTNLSAFGTLAPANFPCQKQSRLGHALNLIPFHSPLPYIDDHPSVHFSPSLVLRQTSRRLHSYVCIVFDLQRYHLG